jgi:hypothetical protein
MNREYPIAQNRRFKNGVIAALEICAGKSAHQSRFNASTEDKTLVFLARRRLCEGGAKKSLNFDERTNGMAILLT